MAYATGSAATTANLMDAILAFAVANAGMVEVVRRTETISSVSRTVVCLQKGSSYFWFYFSANEIRGMPADSDGGTTWANIPGRPTNDSRLFPLQEPYTSYHCFTEGTCVHVAIETSAGWWQHMSFGDVTKVGSWTGGHYVAMQHLNNTTSYFNNIETSQHHPLFESRAPDSGSSLSFSSGEGSFIKAVYNSKNFGAFGGSTATHTSYNTVHCSGFMEGWTYDGPVELASPNAYNNRSSGLPLTLFMHANAGGDSDLLRMMGTIPSIRFVNVKNLNAKDLINTDWMVFPLQSKNVGLVNTYVNTANYGVAYKK